MAFWTPKLDIETRDDGTIVLRQRERLEPYLETLADYIDHWADAAPDRIWLARRGADGCWKSVCYGEARDQARALGAGLLNLGLSKTRPLLILSENSLEHGLLGLACAYVGIPYSPITPAYSLVSEDHAKLKDIDALLEPGAVFADNGSQFERAMKAIHSPRCTIINCRELLPGAVSFESLLETDPAPAAAARARVGPETVLKYMFTSGSTGSPKAVINTNHMICANQAMIRDCYRFLVDEPPVVLDWAPWNHTAAGNKVSYMVLTNGGSYYIDDGKPVPGKFDETIENLRGLACTWYFNVPAGYDRLVEALETDAALAQTFFSRLRMLFYAGAGMAQHTWDRLAEIGRQTTGKDVLIATGLGATETAPFALAWTEIETKAGNLGLPVRELSMKLVPIEDKLEVRFKGPSITPGYFKEPDKTREVFDEEGYYRMGDALRPADPEDLSRGFYFDGRVAENFKLSTGTWVAVGAVRSELVDGLGGLARDAVIVGENRKELGALLWLSESAQSMDKETLRQALAERLKKASVAATGSASRVTRVSFLATDPSFDRGELTEKGSLNQRALRSHNGDLIESLYAGSADSIIV